MKKTFNLGNEPFIELISLLKLLGIAKSGGEAKFLVNNNNVKLNGNIELRKRAKLRKGDLVEIENISIKIE